MHSRRIPAAGTLQQTPGIHALRSNPGRLLVIFIVMVLAIVIAPVSGLVIVEYFHQQGCTNCVNTDPLIDAVRIQYGDRVSVDTIEIDDRAGIRLLMSYGVTEIPVVVINRNRVLSYAEITPERLDEEIRLAESGAYPVPANRKNIFEDGSVSTAVFAFILGLMTGFSPCLLGSLVLLIAAAGGSAVAGRTKKAYPLVFGAGIIAAYLLAATLILGAGVAFLPGSGSRLLIYGTGGIIAIITGLVQTGLFSVPGSMAWYSSGLVSRFHSLPGIFLLGFIFAILFAPCAIAPFLILIGTLLITKTASPLLMLLMFSFGTFVPFIIIAALRHAIPDEQLLKYAGIVQKAGGLLLVGFGIWLILSI
jgi:cytochrome c-type biogenesis protein